MRILSLLLAVVAVLALGCSKQPHDWQEPVKKAFLDGCLGGGASYEMCRCMLRGLQVEYTETEILALSGAGREPPAPDRIMDECE